MKVSILRDSAVIAVSALALVAAWRIAAAAVGAPIILPTPGATAVAVASVLRSRGFLLAVSSTAVRGLLAFGLSFAAGLLAGVAAARSRVVEGALQPFLMVVRSTPIMAVILIAMIWFKTGAVPVFVGFLVGFPIVFSSVVEGIRSVDPDLTEMARAYGVAGLRLVRHVSLPALVPFLLGAASSGLGLTWRVVVGAEILSQPLHAVGTALQTSQARLETASVFAWTIVAIVLGGAAELGLRALLHLVPWRRRRGNRDQ
jgi:NitT/TauT family transport system permease protein